MESFLRDIRKFAGEWEFNLLETGLAFADLGLLEEARSILDAARKVDFYRESPLPSYYLAFVKSLREERPSAKVGVARAMLPIV